eukprot:3913105-Rhodomonas_salina.4
MVRRTGAREAERLYHVPPRLHAGTALRLLTPSDTFLTVHLSSHTSHRAAYISCLTSRHMLHARHRAHAGSFSHTPDTSRLTLRTALHVTHKRCRFKTVLTARFSQESAVCT